MTAKEVADISYFIRKLFKGTSDIDTQTRSVLQQLFEWFGVIDTRFEDCQHALSIYNNDYEDAIMIASSMRSGMDCIITRNTAHYSISPVPIYTPDEFLQQILDQ